MMRYFPPLAPRVRMTISRETQLVAPSLHGPMSPKQIGPIGSTSTEGVPSGSVGTGEPSAICTRRYDTCTLAKVTLE